MRREVVTRLVYTVDQGPRPDIVRWFLVRKGERGPRRPQSQLASRDLINLRIPASGRDAVAVAATEALMKSESCIVISTEAVLLLECRWTLARASRMTRKRTISWRGSSRSSSSTGVIFRLTRNPLRLLNSSMNTRNATHRPNSSNIGGWSKWEKVRIWREVRLAMARLSAIFFLTLGEKFSCDFLSAPRFKVELAASTRHEFCKQS